MIKNQSCVLKRGLSLLLALVMVLSLAPMGLVQAKAAEETAALVGGFAGMTFDPAIANWKPEDPNAEMAYVGNGWYGRTFNVTVPEDVTIQYKIAFNDSWDKCIGSAGYTAGDTNISLTVPAGTTQLSFMVDSVNAVVYDSVTDANIGKSVELRGTMNGWAGGEAYLFTQITNTLYRCDVAMAAGDHEYKYIADSSWIPNDNQKFHLSADSTVTFLYDASNGNILDSVNDPAGVEALLAGSKAVEYTYTVHFGNPDGWSKVNAYAWDANGQILGNWPGVAISNNADHPEWYDVTFPSTKSAASVIFNDGSAQTEDLALRVADGAEGAEAWVTGLTAESVSYTAPEGWDSVPTYTVTVHSKTDWDTTNLYVWGASGAVAGYEAYNAWPGVAMEANANHEGWHTATFAVTEGFNFIFNNGIGSQSADLTTGELTGAMEVWYENGLKVEKPADWDPTEASQLTVHYRNSQNWDSVNMKFGSGASWDALPGFENYKNDEFGGPMTANEDHEGWYDLAVTGVFDTLNFLFNGGAWGGTNQSGNYSAASGLKEIWIDGQQTVSVLTEAPSTWTGEADPDAPAAEGLVTISDKVQVKIGDNLYSLHAYTGGIHEATVAVSGDFTATLVVNGEEMADVSVSGTASETAAIRLQGGKLSIVTEGAKAEVTEPNVELIGTVRMGDNDWNGGQSQWAATLLEGTLYRFEQDMVPGAYGYKFYLNGSVWMPDGMGNETTFTLTEEKHVIFLFDTATNAWYDSENHASDVAALLGMHASAKKFAVIDEDNATTTFQAVGIAGDNVRLHYGSVADAEAGTMSQLDLGSISGGVASGNVDFGEGALEILYCYRIGGVRTLDPDAETVTVGGTEYSVYKRNAYAGRGVYVPGSFPGESWNPASNKMTYLGGGIYEYTFKNVAKGKYEYKIAFGDWDENYGMGGVAGGSNISVMVPKPQDVTVWYNDETHLTQCSVYYDLKAQAQLTGTGIPEGVKLTDPGLSGVYTAELTLAAGEYSGLQITYGESAAPMGGFTLTDEKTVTFCYDPLTNIGYHNASDVKVDQENLYFDSKNEAYKAPFGAVEEDETITFRFQTGVDATSVSLVIKGYDTVPMTRDGEAEGGKQMWVCETSIAFLGEYEYYFAISNGSDLIFYTDDIYVDYLGTGDYGTGTARDMYNLFPYDLVVYEKGFETPDWMKNAVIYQIFPDRFFDGDESNNQAQLSARGSVDYEFVGDWYLLPEVPSVLGDPNYPIYAYKGDGEYSNEIYGGDLKGITEKIGYLKALGVTVIYLNPVFSSISNHRYDACDYMTIDPILGDLGDFRELVDAAEANGMKIILDGVFNHVSDDSVYFDRYYNFLGKSEKIGAYPYWAYVYDYMAEKGAAQADAEAVAKTYFGENYGITDYSYTEWFYVENSLRSGIVDNMGLRAGKEVYNYEGWWGYDSMPVVKSTNGSEFQTGNWAEEIIYKEDASSVTQYWIVEGNDGWRLDVANEVSDETWQNFRDSVKALNSDAVIVGEIWADATRYLLGDMYDSVMNYVFRDAVAGFARGYQINRDNKAVNWDDDFTASDAISVLEIIRERYPEEAFYAMMNLLGSHDTARILSYLDDVEDDRYNQTTAADAYPLYENTSDRAKQLQYVVSFIQFTYAGAPTIYYGDEIGMTGTDDPDDRRAFEWGKGNQELVEWYATLAAVRAEYEVLRTGSVEAFAPDADVMAYVRRLDADYMVALVNRVASEKTVVLDLEALNITAENLKDVLSGAVFTADGNTVTVTVPAYRGLILTPKADAKVISVKDSEELAPAYNGELVAVRHMHTFDRENVQTVKATCTEDGYSYYVCTAEGCDGIHKFDVVTAPGHSFGQWETVKAPTVDETGIESRKCSVCQEDEVRTLEKLPAEDKPEEEKPGEKPEIVNPFVDVTEQDYFYDSVLWAYTNGITTGKDETHFNPTGLCNRSQVVTFLWRASGSPEPKSAENPFPDVAQGKFYTKAVLWAVEQGITTGYKDGTFGPGKTCTRAEVMTFLWRYAGKPEAKNAENPFPDVDMNAYYGGAVLWAVEEGITTGYKDGTFGPGKTCKRDQIVTFLYRALEQ